MPMLAKVLLVLHEVVVRQWSCSCWQSNRAFFFHFYISRKETILATKWIGWHSGDRCKGVACLSANVSSKRKTPARPPPPNHHHHHHIRTPPPWPYKRCAMDGRRTGSDTDHKTVPVLDVNLRRAYLTIIGKGRKTCTREAQVFLWASVRASNVGGGLM